MLNCMECGVPVGVIFATEVGYKVLGLAFVERFEPENGWFVLHGPVHKGGPDPRFAPDRLSDEMRKRTGVHMPVYPEKCPVCGLDIVYDAGDEG